MNQRLILTTIFALKLPVIFSNLLTASLHLSLLTLHIHSIFLSTHHSHLSSHATFCVRSVFPHFSYVSKSPSCYVLRVVSRINYLYLYRITGIHTTPISKRLHSGHVKCPHAMWTTSPKAQSDRSNVQLTSHNSV